ncbi:MAG: heavy metal translocating P-type ATPase, partial [Gemmatimonadales bacterium]
MRPSSRAALLPALALTFIITGFVLRFWAAGVPWSGRVWWTGLLVSGIPVVWKTIRGILARRFAADIVATLAIVTALLLALPLPGLIVVLMQTGGEALERYAEGRASDAVRELEAMAPRTAHRYHDGRLEDIPVDRIEPGDRLLVRPGEMIPCDATVEQGRSGVDTSRLTGEPVPLAAGPGTTLLSGSLNGDSPLTVRATAHARESQYARIVELVRTAQASKSPFQRMADRYAVWFTPLTLVVCAAAYGVSGDWERVLAVLVVATPCPMILAAPVAVIGGINQAARRMIIFRHGGALERLASVTMAVFDKTGTLTIGHPEVSAVRAGEGFQEDEVLRLASAVEHGSGHPLARTVVQAAQSRGILIPEATSIVETPGQGVMGQVDGRILTVGGWSFVTSRHPPARDALATLHDHAPGLRAYVVVDGHGAGIIEYADALRPGLPEFFQRLHRLGIRRTLLLSGDSQANADAVARHIGVDEAQGDLLPAEKVAQVQSLQKRGERVVMVGDGTNDAPALSTASVGVALASGGGGITAEAADVILLADDPTRLADGMIISRRTLAIARQSLWTGLGLSGVAMLVAGAGYIPPTVGALLQEVIDVMVIVNAL